jgi:hypothetical protein
VSRQYALELRVEPNAWGVLPDTRAFASPMCSATRFITSFFNSPIMGVGFHWQKISRSDGRSYGRVKTVLFPVMCGRCFYIMPSVWAEEPALWNGVWLPHIKGTFPYTKKMRSALQQWKSLPRNSKSLAACKSAISFFYDTLLIPG